MAMWYAASSTARPDKDYRVCRMVDDAIDVRSSEGYRLQWNQTDLTNLEPATHLFATLRLARIAPAALSPTELLSSSRDALNSAAAMQKCAAFEYRYMLTPSAHSQSKVDLLFTVKTYRDLGNERLLRAACAAVESSMPVQFVLENAEPYMISPASSDDDQIQICELRRRERILDSVQPHVPMEHLYLFEHDMGDASGWANFWRALPNVARPLEISILFKQTALSGAEMDASNRYYTMLQEQSERRPELDLSGREVLRPADTNAQFAYESWHRFLQKLQTPFLARVAVRGVPEDILPIAERLGAALCRTEDPSQTPASLDVVWPKYPGESTSALHSWNMLEIFPWGGDFWRSDPPPRDFDLLCRLRRFSYMYDVRDAASLALLPVPDERGAIGIPVARRNEVWRQTTGLEGPQDLHIGHQLDRGLFGDSVGMSRSELNRHLLVVGGTGSGKTTTVMAILSQLWRNSASRVPFMVIEPTKCEYRNLLSLDGMEDMYVLTIGQDDVSPLRLNLLEPPPDVRLEEHLGRLMSMFKVALPLWSPLPELLDESLDRTFQLAGWSYDDRLSDSLHVPTLGDLLRVYSQAVAEKGYSGDALNVLPAMQVRLKSLMRGSRGRLLNTIASNNFEALLTRPVVVELRSIGSEDDKSLVAALILERIRAACHRRDSRGALTHVTVLEEAHRIIGTSSSAKTDGDDTREQVVNNYCDAIAELRQQGEGFIMSSQLPTRLAPAAVGNLTSRILHRIESSADRAVILNDFDLVDEAGPMAARLQRGEALFRSADMDDAVLIGVQAVPGISTADTVDDEAIMEHMRDFAEQTKKLMPYALCTRTVCIDGCSPARRLEGERIAGKELQIALPIAKQDTLQEAERKLEGLGPIMLTHVQRPADAECAPADAYCAAVHVLPEELGFPQLTNARKQELLIAGVNLARNEEAADV